MKCIIIKYLVWRCGGRIHFRWHNKPYSKLSYHHHHHHVNISMYSFDSGKGILVLSFYCTVSLIVGIVVVVVYLAWRECLDSRGDYIKWNHLLCCYIKPTTGMIISARMSLMKTIRQKDSTLKCYGFAIGLWVGVQAPPLVDNNTIIFN